MGIKGLWPALREYVDDAHLSQFRGQRVAVDMYVWLHRCIHGCVRINTDAVLAHMNAKYSDMTPALLEPSAPSSMASKERLDGICAIEAARTIHTPDLAFPSIDDVLMVSDDFITSVLDKVAALQRFGVTPVCVFDGKEMPMKGNTDDERQRRRQDAFAEAMGRLEELYCSERRRLEATAMSGSRGGLHDISGPFTQPRRSRVTLQRTSPLYEEAVQLLEKAVDISTELAHAVIQVLQEERSVECIVSPYEADAQLAYLCRKGYVAAAVSEDSDLIAYYCPCIISKLDTFTGRCEVLQPALCAPQFFRAVAATAVMPGSAYSSNTTRLLSAAGGLGPLNGGNNNSVHTRMRAAAAAPIRPDHRSPSSPSGGSLVGNTEDSVRGAAATSTFTYESFLLGCIMAGCDYVANLRSIGIKKAFKLVAHATSLRQVFTTLETEYGFPVEELTRYRRRVLEAFYCFAHHLVYCPLQQEIVTFYPLPSSPSSSEEADATAPLKTKLVGEKWAKEVAQNVCARCLYDPCTLRLYRGTYQSCVTRYLQRTRRGQTSLNTYAGFEELSSSKVVVHLDGKGPSVTSAKRDRADGQTVKETREEEESVHSTFGPPLKKKYEASGFLGAVGAGEHRTENTHAGSNKDVVVVRSRYFLLRGRTAVRERWSASDEDEENVEVGSTFDGQRASQLHRADEHHLGLARLSTSTSMSKPGSGLTDDSTRGAEAANAVDEMPGSTYTRRKDAAAQEEELQGTLHRRSEGRGGETSSSFDEHHSDVKSRQNDGHAIACTADPSTTCLIERPEVDSYAYPIVGDTDVNTAPSAELNTKTPVSQCMCPFGYWQCNRAHSVFESCFLGKQWCQGDASPPSLSSISASATPAMADTERGESDKSASASPGSNAVSTDSTVATRASPQGYTPRAFRPPRSKALPSAPVDSVLPTSTMTNSTVTAIPPPSSEGDGLTSLKPSEDPVTVQTSREMIGESSRAAEVHTAATDAAASPPAWSSPSSMPSYRAAVRIAIFGEMMFKKTS